MTALAHGSRRRSAVMESASGLGPLLLITVAVVAVGVASTVPAFLRLAVAVPATALILAVCLKSYRRSLIVVLLWLAVFGTIRRLLIASGASGDGGDPLLLVAPVVVGLLVVVAARKGAFRDQTRLTKSVLLLTGLVIFSALNPLQGGIAVGAGGLLFVLVPLLWFWVGRALVDDALLTRVVRLISYVAVGVAIYGLFQVYRGFPRWDERWIETKGYAALYVGQSVRPFASFSSSSEYVGMLAIGTVIWALRLREARRSFPAVAALGILGWALAVASVRGALIVVPIALGMTFATSRGFGLGRTALFGIAALFVLGLLITQLDSGNVGGARTAALLSRQVSGLSDPFDPAKSTLPLHIEALVSGVSQSVRNPLGQGLGVTTLAGEKFGSVNASTDIDPSNVALAMGIPGLVAYCVVVSMAMRLAFRRARRHRDLLTLAVLAVALVTFLQWLNGGNYAIAPLPWLLLGWLDRPSRDPDPEPATQENPTAWRPATAATNAAPLSARP